MAKRLTRAQLDTEQQSRAGCISLSYSRATGALVGIYDTAAGAGFDPAGGRWVTVCETHSTVCNHETVKRARYHGPAVDWCEQCMGTDGPAG